MYGYFDYLICIGGGGGGGKQKTLQHGPIHFTFDSIKLGTIILRDKHFSNHVLLGHNVNLFYEMLGLL